MRLLPDDDEREFTSMLRRLLSAGTEPSALWASLADAGVLGLTLPEQYGGSGADLTALGAFCVEAGRALCPTIVHGTLHAGLAVQTFGTAAQHAVLLPPLADGRRCATTALWSPVDAGDVAPALQAAYDGNLWLLNG
ncbi:MAG: acyl-CoA dehydrogenase family protein, partial [Mycobacterium sp.]